MTATPPPPPSAPGSPAAPTAPKPPKTPKPYRRGTWLVAIVALLVSLLSLAVAVTSLMSARTARDEAADAERLAEALSPEDPAAPPAPEGPGTLPATGEPPPPDSPTGSAPPPQSFNPQVAFEVRYSDEVLNPRVTSTDDAYVELDEPRVVFDINQADLVLGVGDFNRPTVFDLGQSNVTAAEAGTPEVTPDECLERIRTSPLPPSEDVPVQRGVVLCIQTSFGRASELGITQKLVVLHVSAFGDNGQVTLELDAWDQPG